MKMQLLCDTVETMTKAIYHHTFWILGYMLFECNEILHFCEWDSSSNQYNFSNCMTGEAELAGNPGGYIRTLAIFQSIEMDCLLSLMVLKIPMKKQWLSYKLKPKGLDYS